MGDPLVSVVMPVRNAEQSLPICIRSIQSQSESRWELVAVDHRSEDGSAQVLESFAREDPRIRIKNCEGSFVEAANHAWQSAQAPMIARMDADDRALPNRLASQIEYLQAHPDVSCCSAKVRIRRKDDLSSRDSERPAEGYAAYEMWINSLETSEDILRERFVDSPVANPTIMIHRHVLEAYGGYRDTLWAEDYDLWLRMLEAGENIAPLNQVVLDWHDSPIRSTRTQDRYSQENFQRVKAHFLGRLPEVRKKGVAICGAGPIGKNMARFLRKEGVSIQAFFEVNEKQIGNRIHGIPVLSSEDCASFSGKSVLIGAVGLRGSRERIRELAVESKFHEGDDFFCVA